MLRSGLLALLRTEQEDQASTRSKEQAPHQAPPDHPRTPDRSRRPAPVPIVISCELDPCNALLARVTSQSAAECRAFEGRNGVTRLPDLTELGLFFRETELGLRFWSCWDSLNMLISGLPLFCLNQSASLVCSFLVRQLFIARPEHLIHLVTRIPDH